MSLNAAVQSSEMTSNGFYGGAVCSYFPRTARLCHWHRICFSVLFDSIHNRRGLFVVFRLDRHNIIALRFKFLKRFNLNKLYIFFGYAVFFLQRRQAYRIRFLQNKRSAVHDCLCAQNHLCVLQFQQDKDDLYAYVL